MSKICLLSLITAFLSILSCGSGSSKETVSDSVPDSVYSIKKDMGVVRYMTVRDHTTLDTIVLGYFDKDRIKDTAKLFAPMAEFEMWGCNPCSTFIMFSNGTQGFGSESDVSDYLENLGDLDQDGIDELGHYHSWFNGTWTSAAVYKNVNGTWISAAYAEVHFPKESFTIKKLIKKLGNGKIVMYSDHYHDAKLTETVFDLKADTLPHIVSEKGAEE